MTGARNLYEILNVSSGAEPVVIEAAYRALMKKYHPDQGAPAEAQSPSAADINRAYSILRDAERRAQYDHHEWTRQQKMHLAQYQPPPPPPAPRVFGWGGWAVALLLAGVILLMARERDDLAVVGSPGAELATPAHAAARIADTKKAVPSFLESNAPEREVEFLRNAAGASSRAAASQAEARAVVSGNRKWSPPRTQKQRAARRRVQRSEARREKDFLEREDYIY
jgi:curved DNA-binding protein CbpA